MSKPAKGPQKDTILTVIRSTEEKDAPARAHTRANALASDPDRIEAARLAATRVQRFISRYAMAQEFFNAQAGWEHYCDSVGGIQSICPERVPS